MHIFLLLINEVLFYGLEHAVTACLKKKVSDKR